MGLRGPQPVVRMLACVCLCVAMLWCNVGLRGPQPVVRMLACVCL